MKSNKSGPQCNAPVATAHWVVQFMHVHLVAAKMTREELAKRSGIRPGTLKDWWQGRKGCSPHINNVLAVLQVLGYTLKPTPINDQPERKRRNDP